VTAEDAADPTTRRTAEQDAPRPTTRWRPSPGDWIDGTYQLGPMLGEGGLGVVFRARDVSLGRDVAIKLLHPDRAMYPSLNQRLVEEARAMAAFEHPRLVTVHACGVWRGAQFVVMELVEGESVLARLRDNGGALRVAEVLHIVSGVAEGLDWLHDAGLQHGDVKPSNILLGEQGAVRLIDAGIAVSVEPADFAGTPAYAAPERMLREHVRNGGRSSDIYSLAVTAFELLTGTRPFQGRDAPGLTQTSFEQHAPSASERRPELAPSVDPVLAVGLARDPGARPASAGGFVASLRSALSGASTTLSRRGESSWPLPPRATRRVLIVDRDVELSGSLARSIVHAIARCTVGAADGVDAALLAAAAHPPDAIIVDIQGASSGDIELVARLASVPGCGEAVVIALTATGGAADLAVLRELGVARLYLKPVAVADILTTLRRAWNV
jgi:serine/threonine protein kinase